MTDKESEINENNSKGYRIVREQKSAVGIQHYNDTLNRLRVPLITRFDLKAATGRIARNILVGELLENPVELILHKINKLHYYRNQRFFQGQLLQAIPDFDVGFQGRRFCIECKNWLSGLKIDQRGVTIHILSRFHRFEDAFGLGASDYTRVAILAGVTVPTASVMYLHSLAIIAVLMPAIHPEGPSIEKLRFLNWALREILNGSENSPYIMTR